MTLRNGNLYCMDVSSTVGKYRGMLARWRGGERRRGRRKGGKCFDWLLRRKKCFGWLCRRKGGREENVLTGCCGGRVEMGLGFYHCLNEQAS